MAFPPLCGFGFSICGFGFFYARRLWGKIFRKFSVGEARSTAPIPKHPALRFEKNISCPGPQFPE
jgi:hypothetical protein